MDMEEFDSEEENDDEEFEDALEEVVPMDDAVEFSDNDSEAEAAEANGEPPVNFDTRETVSHGYLYRHEDVTTPGLTSPCWLEDNEETEVPVLLMNIVVLPGQVLPVQIVRPSDRAALKMAIEGRSYVAFRTCFFPLRHRLNIDGTEDIEMNHGDVGTLMVVEKYVDDGLRIKANLVAKQRCRFLEPLPSINGYVFFLSGFISLFGMLMSTVRVIPEYTLAPFSTAFCPNSSRKLPEAHKLKLALATSNVSLAAANYCDLEKNCDILMEWLRVWFDDDIIKLNRDQGPVMFSYWAAINVPVDMEAKYSFLTEDTCNSRIALIVQTVKQLTELVCTNCKAKVSSMNSVVNMCLESTSTHFVNNYGFVHEMLTVKTVENFVHRGEPVAKFSWFPGYKWQIIECSACMHHLGWEFTSQRYTPAKFYGLSRSSVKPQRVVSEDDM